MQQFTGKLRSFNVYIEKYLLFDKYYVFFLEKNLKNLFFR